jgi:uncharacterized DUF497 family protein
MLDRVDGFDRDAGNRRKCDQHGVSTEEIEAVFRGAPRIAPDPRHSAEETRFIAIGANSQGRRIFIAFTFRLINGARLIRPVSARSMHAKEIDRYEASRS